jgi:hypothetical protein
MSGSKRTLGGMSRIAYADSTTSSETRMLDVHPPHGPTHTWKDFFLRPSPFA